MLAEDPSAPFRLHTAERLSHGLEFLASETARLVLLTWVLTVLLLPFTLTLRATVTLPLKVTMPRGKVTDKGFGVPLVMVTDAPFAVTVPTVIDNTPFRVGAPAARRQFVKVTA